MIVSEETAYVFEGAGYAEKVSAVIIEALEKGTAPFVKPWTPSAAFIPDYNPCSSGSKPVPYRGVNSIYLNVVRSFLNYQDKRWCTFKQAKDRGWSVKAGEHGYGISFFTYLQKDLGAKKTRDGTPVLDDMGKPVQDIRKVPMFQYYTVFNFSQIDGVPPAPEHPEVEIKYTPIESAENKIGRASCRERV